MKKKYYVSDRIIGVYFTTMKALKDYYKRATKIEDMSCGKIGTFEASGLEEYIKEHQTHENHVWNLGQNMKQEEITKIVNKVYPLIIQDIIIDRNSKIKNVYPEIEFYKNI